MHQQFNPFHFLVATPNMSPSNCVQIWFHFNPISKETACNMAMS